MMNPNDPWMWSTLAALIGWAVTVGMLKYSMRITDDALALLRQGTGRYAQNEEEEEDAP